MAFDTLEISSYKLNDSNTAQQDLQRFYEIEKDWLAYLYKEAKVCNDCWNIYSKQEVYWHHPDWKQLDVSALEKKYGSDFTTPCCNTDSKDYREHRQIKAIENRMKNREQSWNNQSPVESYCVVLKDQVEWIIWLCYGNVNTLENIYNMELDYHFTREIFTHEHIKKYSDDQLFITISWVFVFQRYMNNPRLWIQILNQLLWSFAETVDDKYLDSIWIFETEVGTATRQINARMWWILCDLHKQPEKYFVNQRLVNSDLCIHPNATQSYRTLANKGIQINKTYRNPLQIENDTWWISSHTEIIWKKIHNCA